MAGEWIKWSKGLARKPEVMQIAFRLGLTRHAAAGHLMEVWEWADDNVVVDENLSGCEPDTCPGSVRLGADSKQLFDAIFGVSGLADALAAVGWIQLRTGSIAFPNFTRHNGKSAKARALDSLRKRNQRDQDAENVRKMSGSQPDKKRTRGEERRGEKKRVDKQKEVKTEDSSAMASPPHEPTATTQLENVGVLTFPCSGKTAKWELTQKQIDDWYKLYPGLDILTECRKALAWITAKGHKTAKGMPAFLVNWFNRSTDRPKQQSFVGGGQSRPPTGYQSKIERDNQQIINEFTAAYGVQE